MKEKSIFVNGMVAILAAKREITLLFGYFCCMYPQFVVILVGSHRV